MKYKLILLPLILLGLISCGKTQQVSSPASMIKDLAQKIESHPLDSKLREIYKNAEQAIEEKNRQKADFWLARYMGLTIFSKDAGHNYTDLYPLFKKRSDLKPTAFISGRYDEGFLDFFVRGTHEYWGIPEEGISEKDYEFEIRGTSNGKYFVSLVISPELECWYILLRRPVSIAIIPLGSISRPPYIISGVLQNNQPVWRYPPINLDTQGHFLHYVWPIEFHDLDGDGTPEIWIRYNVAWADGFSQMLDIYKIRNDELLILLKKFEGRAEGIARRLKDGSIEVGEGFGEEGHLAYDKHRIEKWKYQNGEFTKASEEIIPHILHSEKWKKYYFE